MGEKKFSRREQQIMDICIEKAPVSARAVWEEIPDQPSYATVRKLMTILVDKGELKRKLEGKKYFYQLTGSRTTVAKSAARRLINTFYCGSLGDAVIGLLGANDSKLSAQEIENISKMIEEVKKTQNPESQKA